MYFKKIFVILSFFLFFLLISCSGIISSLKDGYYTAEMAEFDANGWKEYITICVSGGKIIHIEYDASNSAGFIRSWDMEFMSEMNVANGIYPNAYTRFYGSELLKNQNYSGIDSISGATNSYNLFLMLAQAALDNARTGKTGISKVHRFKQPEQKVNTSSVDEG